MGAWKRSIRTVGVVAASPGVLAIVLGLLPLAVRPPGGQAAGVSTEGGPRFRMDGPDADSFGRGATPRRDCYNERGDPGGIRAPVVRRSDENR